MTARRAKTRPGAKQGSAMRIELRMISGASERKEEHSSSDRFAESEAARHRIESRTGALHGKWRYEEERLRTKTPQNPAGLLTRSSANRHFCTIAAAQFVPPNTRQPRCFPAYPGHQRQS